MITFEFEYTENAARTGFFFASIILHRTSYIVLKINSKMNDEKKTLGEIKKRYQVLTGELFVISQFQSRSRFN